MYIYVNLLIIICVLFNLCKSDLLHRDHFIFSDIGEPGKWNEVILPGIKQGIIGALLASQDEMIDRMNSFELYGADFLLTDDYTPILLEINMGPAMNPSTTITSDLCRRGLQDILKGRSLLQGVLVKRKKHSLFEDRQVCNVLGLVFLY